MNIEEQAKRIQQLEKTLLNIEKRCKSLINDRIEADKVICHADAITYEIAKVYPKYSRVGEEWDKYREG